MKRLSYILIWSLLIFGCHTEQLQIQEELIEETNYSVSEANNLSGPPSDPIDESDDGYCLTTTLIAGQHHEAGTVTVSITDEHIIITYTTNGDWTIDATHLSVGGCDDDSIPTNGSGNPQIGHFEFHSEHSDGVYQVTYTIDIEDMPEIICFAAHAEVMGPTGGETAWAEGEEFSGNSWAMFASVDLSECNEYHRPE